MEKKIWEVDLYMDGPITVVNNIVFRQEKGFDLDQFYSDINFKKRKSGIKATVTAYAPNQAIAMVAAHVYFGKMVDVLSFINDIPIELTEFDESTKYSASMNGRRIFRKDEFKSAFNLSRSLEIEHPKILRAIGWYSKGKITQNKFDQFLAYWNVLEIVGKEYHISNEYTVKGVKNMIYQCFLEQFGSETQWALPENWIYNMYNIRNKIAHGGSNTTVEEINNIALHIPQLQDCTKRLIEKLLDNVNIYSSLE